MTGSAIAHLVLDGVGGFGQGLANTAPNRPYTFGGLVVCLDRPGLVTIDKVEPVGATGGLRIDDWVAVPDPFITGATMPFATADASIDQLGASSVDPRINMAIRTRFVGHTCPTTRAEQFNRALAPIWLYVQFGKPTEATAADVGIAIEYTS
ncbi:MAG TPA: hypothetical protein VH442_14630, partial [Micromonosporaceae bacterium]